MSYVAAGDVPAALAALRAGARVLAGGTDLMVQWAHGAPPPSHVVDIRRLGALRYVQREAGGGRIGALTTCADLLRLGDAAVPGADLWRACAQDFAAVQIRNRATVGGNLATASPASDLAPVLQALAGSVRVCSSAATRDVAADAFFIGYRRTACRADELIESVWVPERAPTERRAWRKVGTRAAQAIAKVSVAVCIEVVDARVVAVRAAAGAVADRPVLLPSLSDLVGAEPTPARLTEVARRAALEDCAPIDDVRSSATYRRHALARVLGSLLQACCAAR